MTEPQGFFQWDAATRILSRPALSYADFLPVPDLNTDEGLEAAANPPPLKTWPAVQLTVPEGFVPVRRLVGFGDRAIQLLFDMQAEGGALVVREGELWAMSPREAEEQCNHPSGLSGWGWVDRPFRLAPDDGNATAVGEEPTAALPRQVQKPHVKPVPDA